VVWTRRVPRPDGSNAEIGEVEKLISSLASART
jgi:hypothetical protein